MLRHDIMHSSCTLSSRFIVALIGCIEESPLLQAHIEMSYNWTHCVRRVHELAIFFTVALSCQRRLGHISHIARP